MEQLLATLWTWADAHILTDANIYMGGFTYAIIWALERPTRKAIERLPKRKQLVWWDRQRTWKNFAAIFWCEIFVWIPTTQPDLCEAGQTEGCQTVFGRIALGAMLGIALSGAHKLIFSRVKRAFGMETKAPKEVTMARKG